MERACYQQQPRTMEFCDYLAVLYAGAAPANDEGQEE